MQMSTIRKHQCEQLNLRIEESHRFAIQLDESTNITKMEHLLTYVRYIYNNHIHEDLLFCQPLHGCTTGMDIFHTVNDFFRKVGLFWMGCVGVYTNGAAAMTGHTAGFYARYFVYTLHDT